MFLQYYVQWKCYYLENVMNDEISKIWATIEKSVQNIEIPERIRTALHNAVHHNEPEKFISTLRGQEVQSNHNVSDLNAKFQNIKNQNQR